MLLNVLVLDGEIEKVGTHALSEAVTTGASLSLHSEHAVLDVPIEWLFGS